MNLEPPTAEATTPKITKTSKKSTWFFWYCFVILALTVLTNRNNPTMLVYTVVGSLILYILPVWIIKTIVQKMRRK